VQDLPLQIGVIHRVKIHDADFADAGRRQVHGDGRAQPARADAKDAGGLDAFLPGQPDFRQNQVREYLRISSLLNCIIRGDECIPNAEESKRRVEVQGLKSKVQGPKSEVQSPTSKVRRPKSKVQSPRFKVALGNAPKKRNCYFGYLLLFLVVFASN